VGLYPRKAVPFLRERMESGPSPAEKQIAKLIANLDADD
jgi:hypothetical protein